jgi:hypothetical protein
VKGRGRGKRERGRVKGREEKKKSFTKATKKSFGINLNKEMNDLYTENYETLVKVN